MSTLTQNVSEYRSLHVLNRHGGVLPFDKGLKKKRKKRKKKKDSCKGSCDRG
jgi:hypothetical protein